MRAILDAVLAFIGAASLSDDEFAALSIDDALDEVANYEALSTVLESREAVSSMQVRLENYYLAKGVTVEPNDTGTSNILVGGGLCD